MSKLLIMIGDVAGAVLGSDGRLRSRSWGEELAGAILEKHRLRRRRLFLLPVLIVGCCCWQLNGINGGKAIRTGRKLFG